MQRRKEEKELSILLVHSFFTAYTITLLGYTRDQSQVQVQGFRGTSRLIIYRSKFLFTTAAHKQVLSYV